MQRGPYSWKDTLLGLCLYKTGNLYKCNSLDLVTYDVFGKDRRKTRTQRLTDVNDFWFSLAKIQTKTTKVASISNSPTLEADWIKDILGGNAKTTP